MIAHPVRRMLARIAGRFGKFFAVSLDDSLSTGESPDLLDKDEDEDEIVYRLPYESIPQQAVWSHIETEFTPLQFALSPDSSLADVGALFPVDVRPPRLPWAYGAQVSLPSVGPKPLILRITARVERGVAGFGLLNAEEEDFLYRVFAPWGHDKVTVYLPIVEPTRAGRVVIQAGDSPESTRVSVLNLELFSMVAFEEPPEPGGQRPRGTILIPEEVSTRFVMSIPPGHYQSPLPDLSQIGATKQEFSPKPCATFQL